MQTVFLGLIGALFAPPPAPATQLVIRDLAGVVRQAIAHPHVQQVVRHGAIARLVASGGVPPAEALAMANEVVDGLPRTVIITGDAAGAQWFRSRLHEAPAARGAGRLSVHLPDTPCPIVELAGQLLGEMTGDAPTVTCTAGHGLVAFGAPLQPGPIAEDAFIDARWDFGETQGQLRLTPRKGALVIEGSYTGSAAARLPGTPPGADFVSFDDTLDIGSQIGSGALAGMFRAANLRGAVVAVSERPAKPVRIAEEMHFILPIPRLYLAFGTTQPAMLVMALKAALPGFLEPADLGLGRPTWRFNPAASPTIERFEFDGALHLVEGDGYLLFGTDPAWTRAGMQATRPAGVRMRYRSAPEGMLAITARVLMGVWRGTGSDDFASEERALMVALGALSRTFEMSIDAKATAAGPVALSGRLRWRTGRLPPFLKTKWSPEATRDWLQRYCDAHGWVEAPGVPLTLPDGPAGRLLSTGVRIGLPRSGRPAVNGDRADRRPLPARLAAARADAAQAGITPDALLVFADRRARTQTVEAAFEAAQAAGFTAIVLAIADAPPPPPPVVDKAFARRYLTAVKGGVQALRPLFAEVMPRCRPGSLPLIIRNETECAAALRVLPQRLPWCEEAVAGRLLTLLHLKPSPRWTGHRLEIRAGAPRLAKAHPTWAGAVKALIAQGYVGLR